MVRRRESQFGIVYRQVAAFQIKQATGSPEIMQQMTIDVEKIGFVTDMSNDMLVPDFGQQRAAPLVQWTVLPLASLAGGISRSPRFRAVHVQASAFPLSKHGKLPSARA